MNKKTLLLTSFVAAASLSWAIPASALVLGTEVTIFDGNNDNDQPYWNETWHSGEAEDNEVEPGMQATQAWDLEGVFLSDSSLTLVGGYNFENGYGNFMPGDLFLSTGDAPVYGDIERGGSNGNLPTGELYGYEYVLQLNSGDDGGQASTFSIIQLTGESTLQTAFYQQNEGSSPWRLASGGTVVGTGDVAFYDSEETALSDDATGFDSTGGTRYAMSFDLQSIYEAIGSDNTFYSHFTMGCGNDNLMGSWSTTVPEPATFALFGMGIVGLWYSRRRQATKS